MKYHYIIYSGIFLTFLQKCANIKVVGGHQKAKDAKRNNRGLAAGAAR